MPRAPGLQILYTEIEYIRDIFGNELVYAMSVWNLLERQFNVSTREIQRSTIFLGFFSGYPTTDHILHGLAG